MVSENFYWRGVKEDEYLTLNNMPKVPVIGSFASQAGDGKTVLDVGLKTPRRKSR